MLQKSKGAVDLPQKKIGIELGQKQQMARKVNFSNKKTKAQWG